MVTQEPSKGWRSFITSAKDLETLSASTRQGFIDQANEKNRRAIAIEKRMHNLKIALENIKQVEDLFILEEYQPELVAAASYSAKGLCQKRNRN
ncbi:MAG: type II restriction endonuclease [Chloroflexota bacterium]|nr:type II restriction endonuclease [Chloroflexota bacterium]